MSIEGKYLLLAEDDRNVAELVVMVLEECGLALDAVVVGDGVEALDYLYCRGRFQDVGEPKPTVILLDLNMPRMNGLDVLRQIKNDQRLNQIPVVMLTSSRDPGDLENCYRSGANAYIVKPIDFQLFKSTIKQTGVFWMTLNEPPRQPFCDTPATSCAA
jgi:CheY-like chemotaxis protein